MRRGKLRKFGRVQNTRKALYKALATALVEHGRIKTTLAKAKSLAKLSDQLITKSVKDDLASRKLIMYYLGDGAARKLFKEICPKFKDRKGGYTKVIRLGRRMSDGSEMAIVEFTA